MPLQLLMTIMEFTSKYSLFKLLHRIFAVVFFRAKFEATLRVSTVSVQLVFDYITLKQKTESLILLGQLLRIYCIM